MDPLIAAIITALGTTTVGVAVALTTISWKIGRWQAQSEERAKAFSRRLDDFIERSDASIADAHKRIDRILDPH